MKNDDLRKQADELEARLTAGRDGRHAARLSTVGRLFTSGLLWLATADVVYVRNAYEAAGDEWASDAMLLSNEVLEAHGYRVKGAGEREDEGECEQMTGPTCWPGGAPPRLGSALEIGPSASATPAGGGGPPAPISRLEAWRQVGVCRKYADWHDAITEHDIWQESQLRRAWMIGNGIGPMVIADFQMRALVQRLVELDESDGELWIDPQMTADYSDGVPGL